MAYEIGGLYQIGGAYTLEAVSARTSNSISDEIIRKPIALPKETAAVLFDLLASLGPNNMHHVAQLLIERDPRTAFALAGWLRGLL